MNDRDRAFKVMDTIRSVLERLPETACRSLHIYINDMTKPEILFTLGTFASALEAFPFTKPTFGPHGDDGEYNAEEFMVDGVRLFQLVKVNQDNPEAQTHEDGAG